VEKIQRGWSREDRGRVSRKGENRVDTFEGREW